MRCLILNHTPPHGSGTGVYTATIARLLPVLGHDAAILTPVAAPAAGSHLELATLQGRVVCGSLPFAFPSFSGHAESHLLYSQLTVEQIDHYQRAWCNALRRAATVFN